MILTVHDSALASLDPSGEAVEEVDTASSEARDASEATAQADDSANA